MKKRVIILLSLLMCLFFEVSVSAAVVDSGVCGNNLTWTLDDEGTLTISGTGDMYNWQHSDVDPESIDTPWRSYLFGKSINNVIIEAGVTSIGNQAFYLVYDGPDNLDNSLVSISIPNSVTKIGKTAFCGCNNLKTIVIPDSVTSIEARAFAGCDSLTSVEIPNSVTSIGDYAFGGCENLKEIFIPESVTSLERNAYMASVKPGSEIIYFYYEGDFGGGVLNGCKSLESITVDANNKMYSSDENGVLFNKDKTVLIKYPIGNKATSYKIPDGVTIIGRAAFEGCSNLESIIVPNSITTIGSYAFSDCTSLTSIVIPESVISVDYGAFEDCTSLVSVDIGNSMANIDIEAFEGCTNLKDITVAGNNELYSKDERGVLFNKDKTILIKYPVEIEETSYEIPDSVTKIYDYAFKGCTSLEEVLIPDSVTSIGERAFEDCSSLEAIVIPNSVTSIGDRAFHDCTNLKSVKIGSKVTNIGGMYAFAFCKSLESIEIPESVTYIGQFSFLGCANLKRVTVLSRNAEFDFGMDYVFEYSTPIIYGYKGSTTEVAAKEDNRPFVAISATPTNAKVLINGKEVAFTAYNIGGNNYFKLRDVAMALNGSEKNFNVGWDGKNNAISLTSNQNYIPVGGELVVDTNAASTEPIVTNSMVYKDSEPVSFIAFNIGGNNYFKLRDIGKAFDFGIGWDNETKTITIDTSISYTE